MSPLYCIGVIFIFMGHVHSFYLPENLNSPKRVPVPINNNNNNHTVSNKINLIEKYRQPKSMNNENLKFSSDGIIKNVHHLIKDFQDEKSDTIIDDEEILYQSKSLPLDINYEKSSLQHQQLSFGPSHLKIDLKREDNNYKVPDLSSSFGSGGLRLRSLEDSIAQANISNEITDKTVDLKQKSLDGQHENQNPVEISMKNLEDHIRDEVQEEIQKENSFESSIIEVLRDIPEPEVRETLKQDLLDSNYPEKQKDIIDSKASNEDQIDFIPQNDKKIQQTENESSEQEINTLTGDDLSDKTDVNKQLLGMENLPLSRRQDDYIVLYKNMPVDQFQEITTEKLIFFQNEQILNENHTSEISQIQVQQQERSSIVDLDFKSNANKGSTKEKSMDKSIDSQTTDNVEKSNESLKKINEIENSNNENEPLNKDHFNPTENRSDDEIIENKVQERDMILSATFDVIEEKQTNQMKNNGYEEENILVEENINQKSVNEIKTDQMVDAINESTPNNSEINSDEIFIETLNPESTSDSKYLREFYTTDMPQNSNETSKVIEGENHSKSSSEIVSVKLNENLTAPLVLPESGIQIIELHRSIHGRTAEDMNILDIPLKFPNSSEIVPLLSVFSVSSNSDTEIFPSFSTNEKNLNQKEIDSFNDVKVIEVTEISQVNFPDLGLFTEKELSERKDENNFEPKSSVLNEINKNDVGQSLDSNDSETLASSSSPKNYLETQTVVMSDVQKSLENAQNEKDTMKLDATKRGLELVQLEFDTSTGIFDVIQIESENNNSQENQTGISETDNVESSVFKTDDHQPEIVKVEKKDFFEAKTEEIKNISDESASFHDNFKNYNVDIESSTDIIDSKQNLKDSDSEIPIGNEKKLFENENTRENLFKSEGETTVINVPFDEAVKIADFKPKAIELIVMTNEENSFKESIDKSENVMKPISDDEEIKQQKSDSSSEESDSSEEDDKSDNEKRKFQKINPPEEPFKFSLYDLLSKSVETGKEIENYDSKINLDSIEQNKTPLHVSSRTNQGRSLSFDETISTDQISQQYLQNQLSSIQSSTSIPSEIILSDEIIDIPLNYDHNVIKRPGVINDDLHKLNDENFKQNISDDGISLISINSHENSSDYTEVTVKTKITVDDDDDNDDKGTITTEERSFNSDNEEVQTALIDTLIEAAELTTDINRHISSFRALNKTNNDIFKEIIDTTTIENSVGLDESSMGEVRPAEIFEEFIQESSVNIVVVILISLIGVITVIAIIFVALFKFKNQSVTLDIQMEGQQENKHNNEFQQQQLQQPQQSQQPQQQQQDKCEKDTEESTSVTKTTHIQS